MSARESTVLIVEPDLDIQGVYRHKLIHDPNIQLAGICSSMASATAILSRIHCDVLLTELSLPDGDGMDLIVRAKTELNVKHCVVITSKRSPSDIGMAMECGATGYIIKGEPGSTELATIVRLAASGGSPISPSIAGTVVEQLKHKRDMLVNKSGPAGNFDRNLLSKREAEILELLYQGKNFVEIGELLGISHYTVTAHIKKIYRKLQAHSRSAAIEEAVKRGLVGKV